jgi:hypothetical protein
MKKPPRTVAFQLDAQRTRRLEEHGKKYGMSAGQYARELVTRALDSDREDLLDALNLLAGKMDETHSDVKKFRGDLSHDLKEIVKLLQKFAERKG